MLKKWKHAWRKEDTSEDVEGGRARMQGNVQVNASEGEVLRGSLASSESPNPEHHILGPVNPSPSQRASSRHIRTIVDIGQDDTDSSDTLRPVKRQKTEENDSNLELTAPDTLSKRLPEIFEVDGQPRPAPFQLSDGAHRHRRTPSTAFSDALIEHAKKENCIAVLDSANLKAQIMSQLLAWSCESERIRPHSGIARRRRIAVVVVKCRRSSLATLNALQSCVWCLV
ncbi:hypothetical protein BD410DRAFT_32633 [Rickenella mellea]|uniref:Uncharacterized protein n=1 Tax=Rickenella mellea TaxID=50990 RepID=A0A4R5XGU0_9AGAM|nr:hypothetical protein BD410DRAFT_32633 [Rickenella mellea]